MQPIEAAARIRRDRRLDLAVAIALAVILTLGWAIHDWWQLSRMLLPDPDDVMRLAQVRDWLGGQGINDWTQHRMAPPLGAPMHWSRVNDIGIAALILAATPIVGRHGAELFAVLTYPALLFAAALYLSARIARRLWGPSAGPVAIVLMALAYPGTTVFIPGRIDHHALQVVLVQLFVLLQMRKPTWGNGMAAGAVTAVSLVVGLETALQIAVLIGAMALAWIVFGVRERARLGGFAVGLGATTLAFLIFLRPDFWSPNYCDAFTPASSTGTLIGAAALGALALATPRLTNWRWRAGSGLALGALTVVATVIAFPACVNGPYGVMDPFLRANFLPFIDEANGLFRQIEVTRILAIGGLMTVGAMAAIWMLYRAPRQWGVTLPVAAVVLVSAGLMLFQVRSAYIGAPLAAPILAGVVLAARRRTRWQTPAVIAAWLACAGMSYSELPRRIVHVAAPSSSAASADALPTTRVKCSAGDSWAQVDRYPAGVIMAGTSVAAYVIGDTRHSTVGAGYHRSNQGNMAMYRFFLSPPNQSIAIARAWKVNYVLWCPNDFDELHVGRAYPDSLAAALRANRPPDWLVPVPLRDTPMRFYRVR